MAGTIDRGMPSAEMITRIFPAGTGGTAGVKYVVPVTVVVSVPAISTGTDSTANAGFLKWINPESGTILVTDVVTYFSTTGTGTIVMGVSSDGTGSASDMLLAGTMNLLNYAIRAYRGRTGTEGAGTVGIADVWRLGPGGSGTNNSIVAKTAELTSTSKALTFITYYVTGT